MGDRTWVKPTSLHSMVIIKMACDLEECSFMLVALEREITLRYHLKENSHPSRPFFIPKSGRACLRDQLTLQLCSDYQRSLHVQFPSRFCKQMIVNPKKTILLSDSHKLSKLRAHHKFPPPLTRVKR